MQVVKVNMPERYGNQESDSLSDYELKSFERLGVDTLIYCYIYESYEGSGFALFRVESKWGTEDMGHCSCNGPTENLSFDPASLRPLSDIHSKGTEDWLRDFKHLFEKAIELGF